MPSKKSPRPRPASEPRAQEGPAPVSRAEYQTQQEILAQLERDMTDTREALKTVIDHIKANPRDAPQRPGMPVPGQAPGAVMVQPGQGVPPVAITPYAPAGPAPGGMAEGPQDIPPGLLQLARMAQDAFGFGAPQGGMSKVEQRLIEGALNLVEASVGKARSETGLVDLIVKRVAQQVGGDVGHGIARTFE